MGEPADRNKMVEALRLTRAGRLTEATALLLNLPRVAPSERSRARDARQTVIRRGLGSVDMSAQAIDEACRTARSSVGELAADPGWRAKSAPPPDMTNGPRLWFDRLKSRSGIGSVPPLRVPSFEVVPGGARFVEGAYRNAAGSRVYKLFIPSRYQGQALPLVVMLHGCTQSADDFAAGTRMNLIAEEQNFFVVYPEQSNEANPAKCWNWFRPDDQQRGRGEPSLIAGITREVMREYSIDPQRVYVGGLSAGGAAAAVMGAAYPDLYAAVGVHSGLACGVANDLPSAFTLMRQGEWPGSAGWEQVSQIADRGPAVPTIVFHGDCDTKVHPRNGAHVIAQSKAGAVLQETVHHGRPSSGHAFTRTVHTDPSGRVMFEHWEIHGAGHAWSGGSAEGSHTDPQGPDATREMLRFFLGHQLTGNPS